MPKVSIEVVDVTFDAIRDPKEREYFMNLPTSFVLPAEDVDRLREVAGRLLRQSPTTRLSCARWVAPGEIASAVGR